MQFLSSAPNTIGSALAALALSLGIAVVLGLFNGFMVSVVGLQPFISTLVMMMAGRGIAKVITGGQNTAAPMTRSAGSPTATSSACPLCSCSPC